MLAIQRRHPPFMTTMGAALDTMTMTDTVAEDITAAPDAMASQAAWSRLESLPFDIVANIFAHLDDYGAVLFLSLTNTRLRASLLPDVLCTHQAKTAFYQHAEASFKQHQDKLVCFRCWRFLPRDAFADSHRKGKRGKGSNDPEEQATRWCWECGTNEDLFALSHGWKKGGRTYFGCDRCKQWKSFAERCDPSGLCSPSSPQRAAFECVPENVLVKILDNLQYLDRIRLTAVSWTMRDKVGDPAPYGSFLERAEFIKRRAYRARGGWGLNRRRACFGCWRVRPLRKFPWSQRELSSSVEWRRRCESCIHRFYVSKSDDARRACERFHRQIVCPTCFQMRYADKACESCALDADKYRERERIRQEKVQRRKKRDELGDAYADVLARDEPGLVDWFNHTDLADAFPHLLDESDQFDVWSSYYSATTSGDEDHDTVPGPGLVAWMTLVGLHDQPAATREQPSEEEPVLPCGDFNIWLLYNRLLEGGTVPPPPSATRTTSPTPLNKAETTTTAANTFDEQSPQATLPTVVAQALEDMNDARRSRRFLAGQMTLAEESLWRVQAFVERHRQRVRRGEAEAEQTRSRRLWGVVSRRWRGLGLGLGLGITSRREEMVG